MALVRITMPPFTDNPFAILTFLAAPAVLTNAASVLILGTSNRFARAVDRARTLAKLVQGKQHDADPETAVWVRQLRGADLRIRIMMRALTAFYTAMGTLALASLAALLGAIFYIAHYDLPRVIFMFVALGSGLIGVTMLVLGSSLLVWETRVTLSLLREETALMIMDLNTAPKLTK